MKTILIQNFKNLNNYGSGIMGLITIKKLYKELNGDVEFYSDFDEYADMKDIFRELDEDISLKIYKKKVKVTHSKLLKPFYTLSNILSNKDASKFDLVIVLGGDDLSEYYGKHVWPLFLSYYSWSFKTKVVLLGQSIGPFNFWFNRFSFRKLANRCKIFTRDKFCYDYLKNDLGIKKNVTLSGDLAFLDLPLQHSTNYQNQILNKYHLEPNGYVSIVISGLFGKYYTNNKESYFNCYKELIKKLKATPGLEDKKICFLAHTFPPHGDEAELLSEFENFLGTDTENVVFITEKVLQAGARFILGNGILTITGRMHASVSTFQMGKPSISLSYSVKYKGVIGDNLGRNDLIIEANKPPLWENGEIVDIIIEKVQYILNDYQNLKNNIETKIEEQKVLVNNAFNEVLKD